MTPFQVGVAGGDGLAARWGETVLVMLAPLDAPGCEEVLDIIRTGATGGIDGRALAFRLGAFMGEAGPDAIPSFGLIAEDDGRRLVLLHGEAMVHATGPGTDETLVGTDRPTWVDDYLPDGVDRVEVGPAGAAPATPGPWFDLVEGVVPAGGVVLAAAGAEAPAPVEPEADAAAEEAVAEEAVPAAPADAAAFRPVDLSPPTGAEAREPLPVAGPADDDEADDEPAGELVEGVRCIRAHFNHPEARYCAHCGIGMVQQTHQLVRDVRPPLGILVFDDGTTLSLDASYVIGRDPSRDESVAAGDARPFVLEDPDQVLSRVHAEVRLSGWEVELVDRGSANGTYVVGDDGEWERIEADTPFNMQPGTQARVGRQEFVFDSHHRRG